MYLFNVTQFGNYSFRKLTHEEFMFEFGKYIPDGLELYAHITDIIITIDGNRYLIRRVVV